jgi:hypothetical protein
MTLKLFTIAMAIVVIPFLSCHQRSQRVDQNSLLGIWGDASNGLRLAISSTRPGAQPQDRFLFILAIQNIGEKDVVLNLGSMLSNGKVMFPEAIELTLTDTSGKTRGLRF